MTLQHHIGFISSFAYFVEYLELYFKSSEVFSFENHEEVKHAFYSQCNDTRKVLKCVNYNNDGF